jgi:hypothetical protein
MKNLITRGICLALTMVLAFSLTACGGDKPVDTTPSTTPATTAPATSVPETTTGAENVVAMNYFSLSYGENFDSTSYISIYDNEDGTATVDYQGEIRKSGTVDASIFEALAAEFAKSGLVEMNGAEEWNEGEASASMYVTYADDTFVSANYGGTIPQAFIDAYNAMDTAVQALIADIPEYVPEAAVMGNVDETVLAEIKGIIGNTSMPLDSLVINEILMDENFAFNAGLSKSEGIANAANCNSMMMTTAYSLVIVTVEDAANIASVRADFEAGMDWRKWVCVQPTNALIAQKDNMVLCLMAMDQTYTETEAAINAAGWTEVTTFANPEL